MSNLDDKNIKLAEVHAAAIELMKSGADDQATILKYSELTAAHELLTGGIYFEQINQSEQQVKANIAAAEKVEKVVKVAREKARLARENADEQAAELRRFMGSSRGATSNSQDEINIITKVAELEKVILDAGTADKLAALAFSKARDDKGKADAAIKDAQQALDDLKARAAAIPALRGYVAV